MLNSTIQKRPYKYLHQYQQVISTIIAKTSQNITPTIKHECQSQGVPVDGFYAYMRATGTLDTIRGMIEECRERNKPKRESRTGSSLEAYKLYMSGLSKTEASRRAGCSISAVIHYIKRNNLEERV